MHISSLQARHFFAAFVHFVAFWFLLGFALAEDSSLSIYNKQFWWVHEKWSLVPRQWYFKCYNTTSAAFDVNYFGCSTRDKRFYVKRDPSESITYINALVLACLYVGWSALGHFVAALMPAWQRVIRWLDYSVTAPTMLVVLSISFGAESATAIVVAPSLLAILLVLAGILERRADCDGVKSMSYYRVTTIALLFLLFVPTMIPAIYASNAITKDGPPGTGTAPQFVFAFALAIVILFSSFAAVYAWDMIKPMESQRRERWYIYLSMIAKTSLHLFLGLTIIEQSSNVGVNEPSTERDDMETLAIGLGGAFGLIIGLGIINYYFDRILECLSMKIRDEKTNERLYVLLRNELYLPEHSHIDAQKTSKPMPVPPSAPPPPPPYEEKP